MRLASSPDALRQQRAERLRRDHAAARALRVAFPTVQQLRIELSFEGSAASTPAAQSHVLHPAARAFFEFRCPYADCDGEFNLTSAVNIALGNKTGKTRGTLQCSGHRPEQHGSRKPCNLLLSYAIAATYQNIE